MSKHTPGPWVIKDPESPRDVHAVDGELLATAYPMGEEQNRWKESELLTAIANARLIAAAPRLLEALKGILQHRLRSLGATCPDCEPGCDHGASVDFICNEARAAIREAEGDESR